MTPDTERMLPLPPCPVQSSDVAVQVGAGTITGHGFAGLGVTATEKGYAGLPLVCTSAPPGVTAAVAHAVGVPHCAPDTNAVPRLSDKMFALPAPPPLIVNDFVCGTIRATPGAPAS